MQLRLFVPELVSFSDVSSMLSSEVKVVEGLEELSLDVPLRNENHQDSYVIDLRKKEPGDYMRLPASTLAGICGIAKVSDEIVIVECNDLRVLEIIPIVESSKLKSVSDVLTPDYDGIVYRESYPIVSEHSNRADGRMWLLSVREDMTREVSDLLNKRYNGEFAMSTGNGEPVLKF